jgi:hypothetical protein
MKFKVGDLVKWADFIGIIIAEEFVPPQVMWRVFWTDGGESLMYEDEIELTHPTLEAINESR